MSITTWDFQIPQSSMEISASKMTVNGLCLDVQRLGIKLSKSNVSNKKSVERKACMFMKSFHPRRAPDSQYCSQNTNAVVFHRNNSEIRPETRSPIPFENHRTANDMGCITPPTEITSYQSCNSTPKELHSADVNENKTWTHLIWRFLPVRRIGPKMLVLNTPTHHLPTVLLQQFLPSWYSDQLLVCWPTGPISSLLQTTMTDNWPLEGTSVCVSACARVCMWQDID